MTSETLTPVQPPEAPQKLERELTLAERNERERLRAQKLRKRLFLWAIPLAILVALLAIKLISMSIVGGRSVSLYEGGDYEGSLNSSQQQKFVNIIERWKAPYNTGTNYLQLGLLPEARAELESALPLASPLEQCPIRSNLAITLERMGDAELAAGRVNEARDLWMQGLTVLDQAAPECDESTSDEPMDDTQQRIEEKLAEEEATDPNDPNAPPPPDASDIADDISDIQDQLEDNQGDRTDQINQDNNSDNNSGYTDKPW